MHHARRGLRALAGLAAVVALATGVTACSTGSSGTPSTPTIGSTAATPTPSPTEFAGDLRTLLLATPASAAPTTGPNNTDGQMDADQAAAMNGSGTTTDQMKTSGYRRGAIGQWVEPDGTWVGIIVSQFGDLGQATVWAASGRDAFEANKLFAAGVPIPGVFNGKVYARTSISDNGRWFSEAVFSKNTIAVELFVTGPVRHDPQKAVDLAVAQYARLP